VYGVPQGLRKLCDGRRLARISTFDVVNSLLHAAVLRIPSLNMLEAHLSTPEFKKLLGLKSKSRKQAFSADTIADVLDTLDISRLNQMLVDLVFKAERNKAFRDDTYGTFRCVAIDGWEPFCSYERHCPNCLSRRVRVKSKRSSRSIFAEDDEAEYVTQYYHRFVVAFLIAPKLDMTLAIEPVLSEEARPEDDKGHEGELTASLRLIDRLNAQYGTFIDAFALDGLYPCGPVLEKLHDYRYGAFITTKNKKNDPYRFANEIWEIQNKPGIKQSDPDSGEELEFWEMDNIDALKTFKGKVKMLKAQVTATKGRREGKTSTWAMLCLGKARNVPHKTALKIMRARWHIENTAFHQWVTKWHLDHCYRHTPNAITAVMLIWSMAFNLMQLFFYRRLKKPRKGRKVTDTIKAMVMHFNLDIAALIDPVPWSALDDTG
jgi:hypothetical protein